MFEYWIDSDLTRLPIVKQLNGNVFSQDSGANKIGVRVTENGEPVTLSGTVKAFIKKPDGETLDVTGTASGNEAYVVLPSSAYNVVGMLGVYVRIETSDQTITLGGIEGRVYPSIIGQTIT